MTLDIIKKAANAMIKGKDVSSYDLPAEVEKKIVSRRYSASEINAGYRKANNAR